MSYTEPVRDIEEDDELEDEPEETTPEPVVSEHPDPDHEVLGQPATQ